MVSIYTNQRLNSAFAPRSESASKFGNGGRWCAWGVALWLSGCTLGPDYVRPAPGLPTTYRVEPTGSAASVADPGSSAVVQVKADWWTAFGDETLNGLVQQALAGNLDVQAALARVEAAQAAAREVGADRYPGLNLGLQSTRNQTSGQTFSGQASGPALFNQQQVALSLHYELDWLGKVQGSHTAARAQALASQYGRDVVRLTLAGQVAVEYLNLRTLEAQLKAAQESLQARVRSLKIVQARLEGGVASGLDLAQAQTALAGAEADVVQLRRQQALSEHQMALLIGQPAWSLAPRLVQPEIVAGVAGVAGVSHAGLAAFRQPLALPVIPPPGVPSRLLEARPDIRQAEAQLVAANARIGVARAAYFPSISLTGVLGSESEALARLLGSGAGIWSIGLGLMTPIFDAGRTEARVDQATAQQQEALANYQKSIQAAFKEVRDALNNLKHYADQELAVGQQLEASQRAFQLAEGRYASGYVPYLEVLDSQGKMNAAQQAVLAARKNRLVAAVDLFKALGGGWQEATSDLASNSTPEPRNPR